MKYVFFFFLLLSCSSEKPQGKTEAEILYKEAKELIDNERYLLATEKLNQIRSQHPYSYYATSAELLSADVLFKQENYIEAAGAYLAFKDLYPKYKDIEYVLFMIAEAYYYQLPDGHDRDLSGGVESLKYYEELVNRFPQSPHIARSKERVKEINELVKKKEKYIADFYFKTEKFEAAIWRYQNMLSLYPDEDLRKHSALRIVEANLNLEKYSQCEKDGEQFKNESQDPSFQSEIKTLVEDCRRLGAQNQGGET